MYISTVEASRLMKCSKNAIHKWCKLKLIEHRYETHKSRKFLMIEPWSLHAFMELNKGNARIGRKLKCRSPNRRPTLNRGYVLIHDPSHPMAYHDGYVAEHVLVAEKMLGRPLKRGEHVHHKNRVKHDNRPENLIVYASQSEHMKQAHSVELVDKISNLNRG